MDSLKEKELKTDQQLYLLGNTQQSLLPALHSPQHDTRQRDPVDLSLALHKLLNHLSMTHKKKSLYLMKEHPGHKDPGKVAASMEASWLQLGAYLTHW